MNVLKQLTGAAMLIPMSIYVLALFIFLYLMEWAEEYDEPV